MRLERWFIDQWAGYWHLKWFKTGDFRYWIIGALPVADGFAPSKVKF